MVPFVYEWHWDIGHIVFMGLFYTALGIVVMGLMYCIAMTFKDMFTGNLESGWHHHDDHGHDEPEEGAEGEEAAAEEAAEAAEPEKPAE